MLRSMFFKSRSVSFDSDSNDSISSTISAMDLYSSLALVWIYLVGDMLKSLLAISSLLAIRENFSSSCHNLKVSAIVGFQIVWTEKG